MAEAIIDAQASDRRRARASQGASYVLQTNYGGAVTPLGDGMENTFVHGRVFDAYRVARTPEVEHKTTNFLFSRPVPENKKVRFSSSYAVLVLVVDHVVAVNVIVVVVTVVVT